MSKRQLYDPRCVPIFKRDTLLTSTLRHCAPRCYNLKPKNSFKSKVKLSLQILIAFGTQPPFLV